MPTCASAAACEPVLEAHIRAGGGRFRGIRHIRAWDADPVALNPAYSPPQGLLADKTFREGFARARRRSACPSTPGSIIRQIARPDRPGARLPRHADRARTMSAARSASAAMPAARRGVRPLVGRHPRAGRLPERRTSSWAASACASAASASTSRPSRQRSERSGRTPGAPISRPASRRSAPTAACSRATSRSTRAPTATPPSGTPASSWRRRASASEKADLFCGTAARFYRLDLPG